MGHKIRIINEIVGDEDEGDYDDAPRQRHSMQRNKSIRARSSDEDRSGERYVEHYNGVRTRDPAVDLQGLVKRSTGFDVHPALIAAVVGAAGWGMFRDMLIAGAIAAGGYLVWAAKKKVGG